MLVFNIKLDVKFIGFIFIGYFDIFKKIYYVEFEFYVEIDFIVSKINYMVCDVEMKLCKKELIEEYWFCLFKEFKKMYFFKIDFDKWVDEDE